MIMLAMSVAYAAAGSLLVVATAADILITHRGLDQKVAVEANTLEVKLYGVTPTLSQLIRFNVAETFLVLLPSFVGLVFHSVIAVEGGLGLILGNAARHYFKGYKGWKNLGAK